MMQPNQSGGADSADSADHANTDTTAVSTADTETVVGTRAVSAEQMDALTAASATTRANAVEDLAATAREEAIPRQAAIDAIFSRLDDENPSVRATACDALGRLGAERAESALKDLRIDPDRSVSRAASRALQQLESESTSFESTQTGGSKSGAETQSDGSTDIIGSRKGDDKTNSVSGSQNLNMGEVQSDLSQSFLDPGLRRFEWVRQIPSNDSREFGLQANDHKAQSTSDNVMPEHDLPEALVADSIDEPQSRTDH